MYICICIYVCMYMPLIITIHINWRPRSLYLIMGWQFESTSLSCLLFIFFMKGVILTHLSKKSSNINLSTSPYQESTCKIKLSLNNLFLFWRHSWFQVICYLIHSLVYLQVLIILLPIKQPFSTFLL